MREARTAVFGRWLVGLLGLATLAWYTTRYPPVAVALGVPAMPRGDKVLAALGSLAALLVVDLAALAAGSFVARPLSPKAGTDDLATPVELGLGLLVLAYAVLGLAALGRLARPTLLVLLAIPIIARLGALARAARSSWRPMVARSSWRGPMLAAGLVAVAGSGPLVSAFVPFYGWDALTYHLAIPERYLFHRGIWVTPFSFFTASPQIGEMLYTLALGVDGPALAKLVNVQYAVLLVVTAYRLAARRSRRAGLVAVALVVGEPLLQWEATIAYTDVAVAFHALLAAAALADWEARGHESAFAWRAAVFAGACAAIKYTGAAVPRRLACCSSRRDGAAARPRAGVQRGCSS
jgi:hypothetical protein